MPKPAIAPRRLPRSAGLIAIALAATLWAIAAAVASDLFDDGVEPLELVQARAYVTLVGLALIPAAWRRPDRAGSPVGPIALGLSIALVNTAYYLALDRIDVAVALVLQYAAPVIVVAWAALYLKRRPGPEVKFAVVGALVGVVLVSGIVSEGIGRLNAFGLLMGLGSAFMFATYTLVSESVAERLGVIPALLRGFGWATLMWLIYQVPQGVPESLVTDGHLPRVLFVGGVGTLAPFLLFLWGVQRVRAERAVIVATLEPVVAGVIAWAWLGQTLSVVQVVGGAIVIACVVALQIRSRTEATEPALVPEP
jgi:drug/metabolite transporter, DME family